MPPRVPPAAATAERGDRLGWLLLIPLGCLILGQALLAHKGILPVLDGGLADPDSYMRLNRVLHLHATGEWFDATYPRINPPHGHVQHWTRPLDALLLAGAWLLAPFLGFRTGLHVWGVLFSPICLALSILALNWATAPALDRDARLIACLLLLLQPAVVAYSSLGRPDHHGLLFLLFILTIGFTGRLLLHQASRWTPVAAGAVAALGLWVSTESLIILASALAVLGLYWLAGDRALAAQSGRLAGWTTAFLALALVLERGAADIAAVETDRLSVLHVTLFGLIALFWGAVIALERSAGASPWRRILSAGAGAATVALALVLLFPDVRQGPLGEVDPLYKELRFERILEVQPLVAPHQVAAGAYAAISSRLIQSVGIAVLALPFLVLLLVPRSDLRQRFWVTIAVPLALFLPLAVWQIRWSGYAQILLVIPYGALIGLALAEIGRLRLAGHWRVLVRSLVLIVATFWPVAAIAALPKQEVRSADKACPLSEIATWLNQLDSGPKTVLALADYGPELLYRTPHRVLSIPNHRPQPGFTTSYRTLSTTSERVARVHVARSGVDWILLCPNRAEQNMFGGGWPDASFYGQLLDGVPPPWLRPIKAPDAIGDRARLFEVRRDPVRYRSALDH